MSRLFAVLLAIAVSTAATTTKWGQPSDEDISVLTDDTFQDFVASHKYVFVMFTSPDCPHCKKAKPQYVKLAQKFAGDDKSEVVIALVDTQSGSKTMQRFQVTAYPTFKYFFNGIPIDYKVDRTERYMTAWLNARTKDRAIEITSWEQYETVKKEQLSGLLYLGNKNKKTLTNFNALAATFVRVKFYFTYLDEVKKDIGASGDAAFLVVRAFDEGNKLLNSKDLSYETLFKFFDGSRVPLVSTFTQETAHDVFGRTKTAVLLFTEDDRSPQFKAFQKVAQSRRFEHGFAKSTIKSGLGKKMAELLGVTEKHLGQVRLVKYVDGNFLKYKLEDVTEESLATFLVQYNEGHLKTYLKSEKPVSEYKKGHVTEVVGEDFEKQVFESKESVFLMIYSHDCTHCQEAKTLWDKLAIKVAHIPHLTIARMNGVTNEHPTLNIHHYPTFKLYKRGHKSEPLTFDGHRNLKSIANYLKSHLGEDWNTTVNFEDDSL